MSEVNTTEEETGKWVIIQFFPNEPVEVYGFFDTEDATHAYAKRQGMDIAPGAYSVKMVLNAHLEWRREAWE